MFVCMDRFKSEVDGTLMRYIISELDREGLLKPAAENLDYPVMPHEHSTRMTTDFGADFVRFIMEKPGKP